MKNLKATVGAGAMVTWVNKEGERVALPLIKIEEEWKQVGVLLKYGASRSDPEFATSFPVPPGWKPNAKILQAIRKVS